MKIQRTPKMPRKLLKKAVRYTRLTKYGPTYQVVDDDGIDHRPRHYVNQPQNI